MRLEAESLKRLRTLFESFRFFLNRETPKESLTFIIRLAVFTRFVLIAVIFEMLRRCHFLGDRTGRDVPGKRRTDHPSDCRPPQTEAEKHLAVFIIFWFQLLY